MSVIFGIKENDRIIIAGDKRSSTINGGFISDDRKKVVEVNKHLCIAFAGNVAVKEAIIKSINSLEMKETLLIEDILKLISGFYDNVIQNQCMKIGSYQFSCLIAGKGKDQKGHLYSASQTSKGFQYKEVPMALYSPPDVNNNECNNIFVRNYKLHHKEFCERTVKEISKLSSVVSSSGNYWVYMLSTNIGEMREF